MVFLGSLAIGIALLNDSVPLTMYMFHLCQYMIRQRLPPLYFLVDSENFIDQYRPVSFYEPGSIEPGKSYGYKKIRQPKPIRTFNVTRHKIYPAYIEIKIYRKSIAFLTYKSYLRALSCE